MHDSYARATLPAGAILFEEGEPGEAAYILSAGTVEVFVRREGREVRLAMRGAGDIVGEMALLDSGPRSASARVLEDCAFVLITEDQIRHRVAELDPILRMCLGVVLSRYRDMLPMVKEAPPPTRPDHAASSSPGLDDAIGTLVLERELRHAIAAGELAMFFQPIVRLDGARIAGFEALMRWHHPRRGLVPPAAFIPVAEASGLVVDLTRWALDEVCRVVPAITLAALQNPAGLDGVPFLSVNVSGHDLALGGFPASIAEILTRTGTEPGRLKLEITESVLMDATGRAAETLGALRASGLGVAIDDFGTGYSSLSYLSTLPISTLKVDRAFVCAMLGDPRIRKVVQTILRLADEFALPVVAEGIESPEEAQALLAMGCAFGQGYLFGKATPLPETLALIRSWAPHGAAARLRRSPADETAAA